MGRMCVWWGSCHIATRISVSYIYTSYTSFISPHTSHSQTYPLHTVIQALVALVHDPEPEHPLRGDLAEEYTRDRKKFERNAEEFTKKYAEKRPAD